LSVLALIGDYANTYLVRRHCIYFPPHPCLPRPSRQ
jgi:hypothetical protein